MLKIFRLEKKYSDLVGKKGIDHVELPGNQNDGWDERKGVSLADSTSSSERLAKSVGELDGPNGVGMKDIPGIGEVFGHASVDHQVMGKFRIEGVEKLVVVVRHHGRIELMEEGMFKVTLGIPRHFKWLSSRYSTGQVRVGNLFDPRFKLLVEGSRFNSVACTVN